MGGAVGARVGLFIHRGPDKRLTTLGVWMYRRTDGGITRPPFLALDDDERAQPGNRPDEAGIRRDLHHDLDVLVGR